MCGIAGYISGADLKFDMGKALESIAHRGPDRRDSFCETVASRKVGFGHTRLSIIDLSEAGNQPMHINGVSLVYNGEVYNYQELRRAHLRDAPFHGKSDTEVVLRLYLKFGKSFVEMLEGDFAIAMLDRNTREVHLYRDRMGVKPLYIYRTEKAIAFASEIKAFKAAGLALQFDESQVGNYLVFKYTPGQDTMYREVKRLSPGHHFTVDLDTGNGREDAYWSIPKSVETFSGSYKDAQSELRRLLQGAVERRLVGDVPIANYLSGGLDSSIIAHYLKDGDHKHYCAVKRLEDLKAEGTTSDGYYARKLANAWKLDLEEIPIGLDQLTSGLIAEAVRACDDLIADGSVIPAMQIAKQAATDHRVVLSGMGADELFLGYNGHMLLRLSAYAGSVPGLKSLLSPVLQKVAAGKGPFLAYRRYLQKWGNNMGKDYEPGRYSVVGDVDSALSVFKGKATYEAVFSPYFDQGSDLWDGLFRFEKDNFLVKNLHYLDRSSMAYGLESRVPFLDHHLVEFAASLPVHFKLGGDLRSKRILKDAYSDVLPRYVTQRRKAGFGMPLRTLLTRPEVLETLLPLDFFGGFGCFDMDAIHRLITAHQSGHQDQSALIYALIAFRSWWLEMEG